MTQQDLCVFITHLIDDLEADKHSEQNTPPSLYLELKLITPLSLGTNGLRYRKSSENVRLLVIYEGEQMTLFWFVCTCPCMQVHVCACNSHRSILGIFTHSILHHGF